MEQRIATVLSNVEISILGYDLSSAKGNSFDAEAEASDRQYRQLIASLRETITGPLGDDISKTVRSMVSKKLAEKTSPAGKD